MLEGITRDLYFSIAGLGVGFLLGAISMLRSRRARDRSRWTRG